MNVLRRVIDLTRTAAAALALLAVLTGAALAQVTLNDEVRTYLEGWNRTADRAVEVIEANRASIAALEALREEIADYRRTFLNAREDNTARLATLQAQMDALGPAPAEGATEPADIAEMRRNIQGQIDELRVPVVVARENYTRADGLIDEIDKIVREREAKKLFERVDSPLNPTLWLPAWQEFLSASKAVVSETRENLRSMMEQNLLRKFAPMVLALTAAGLLLLLRGRLWAERFGNFMRRFGGRGSGVWGFVISLGRIALPLFGVFLLSSAVVASQVLGLRGQLILQEVPAWATMIFGYRWVAERLYPKRDEDSFLNLERESRGIARRNMFGLGVIVAMIDMVSLFEEIENLSSGTRAIMGAIPVLVGSLLLLRLRQILRREMRRVGDAGKPEQGLPGYFRIGALLRILALVVALAAPVLAFVGFTTLSETILYAFILTIGLSGAGLVLQRFLTELYGWLSGKGVQAVEESIVPFLIGLLLILLALPPTALIWGARVADLTELWQRFLEGVPLGGARITPVDFLMFVVVFSIGYSLTRMFQASLRNNLLPKTKIDPGGQNAIVSGTGYVGIFLAALIAVSTAGIDLSGLAIVAGALSVGIGFGLQTIVSNFVSGIILLIERPISEGDWIEVNGQEGYVRDISVRSTRIETFDRSDVIVPNADLVSGQVTNYTRGNTVGRVIVPVGVAYGTETRKVEAILREVAEGHPMVLTNPPPSVLFRGFGADSLDFEIRAILRDVNWVLSVKSDMNHEINRRFSEVGIEIPFAQRDIWLRNPETLTGKGIDAEPSGAAAEPAATAASHIDVDDMPEGDDGNDQ